MVKINCSTKDTLLLSELEEFQGNLKERENADFEKIERSIKKHGFSFPFFVWKHDGINHVLDGHGRIGALNRMVAGGEEIPPLPVVYVQCKDEREAKEILLKLNSQYGRMTAESVRDFIGDIEINIDDIALPDGFLDLNPVIDDIDAETRGDDEVPEVPEEPVSKPGEMYELGNSILLCGDSLNEEDVTRLIGSERIALTFTDPPYELGTEGGGS